MLKCPSSVYKSRVQFTNLIASGPNISQSRLRSVLYWVTFVLIVWRLFIDNKVESALMVIPSTMRQYIYTSQENTGVLTYQVLNLQRLNGFHYRWWILVGLFMKLFRLQNTIHLRFTQTSSIIACGYSHFTSGSSDRAPREKRLRFERWNSILMTSFWPKSGQTNLIGRYF